MAAIITHKNREIVLKININSSKNLIIHNHLNQAIFIILLNLDIQIKTLMIMNITYLMGIHNKKEPIHKTIEITILTMPLLN